MWIEELKNGYISIQKDTKKTVVGARCHSHTPSATTVAEKEMTLRLQEKLMRS